jgi:hypothetical protein
MRPEAATPNDNHLIVGCGDKLDVNTRSRSESALAIYMANPNPRQDCGGSQLRHYNVKFSFGRPNVFSGPIQPCQHQLGFFPSFPVLPPNRIVGRGGLAADVELETKLGRIRGRDTTCVPGPSLVWAVLVPAYTTEVCAAAAAAWGAQRRMLRAPVTLLLLLHRAVCELS